jgi:hypothetical protein
MMKKILPARSLGRSIRASILCGCAFLAVAACASRGEPSAKTTTTMTQQPSSSQSRSTATTTTTPSTTTTSTTTTSVISTTAIRSIVVEADHPYCIDSVGEDLYQIGEYCSKGGSFNVRWTSRGEDGDVKSSNCAVIVDVTGAGDLNERRHSGDCTGYDSDDINLNGVPGAYTLAISITPADGGVPMTATKTINVIAYGT